MLICLTKDIIKHFSTKGISPFILTILCLKSEPDTSSRLSHSCTRCPVHNYAVFLRNTEPEGTFHSLEVERKILLSS